MRNKNLINNMRQTKIHEFFNSNPQTNKINEINLHYKKNNFSNRSKYILRFDGASKGNPGKAGAGAVIYHNNDEIWNSSKYIGNKFTCNYAEYYALVLGLKGAIHKNITNLYVEGDSKLVINQINGTYAIKSEQLKPLYNEAKDLIKNFNYINFKHIYRNFNTRADELANLLIK
jgi:ribonuclease HI